MPNLVPHLLTLKQSKHISLEPDKCEGATTNHKGKESNKCLLQCSHHLEYTQPADTTQWQGGTVDSIDTEIIRITWDGNCNFKSLTAKLQFGEFINDRSALDCLIVLTNY